MSYEFQEVLKNLRSVREEEKTVVVNAEPSEIERVRNSLKKVDPEPVQPPQEVTPTEIQQAIDNLKSQNETELERVIREINTGKKNPDPGELEIKGLAGMLRASFKHEVNREISQTMSGMAQAAWNASYSWRAKFAMYLVDNELLVEIRALVDDSPGVDKIKLLYTWRMEIAKKWQSLALVWHDYTKNEEQTIPVRVTMTFDP